MKKGIYAGLLFIFAFASTQAQVTNTSNSFTIGSGATVTIDAPSVSNTGAISNNGILLLTGNWSSAGTYTGAGDLVLEGVNQAISHTGIISNLSVAAAGIKTLNSELTVSGTLALKEGIVNTRAADLIITGAISGGSETSYVNGPLFQNASVSLTYHIGTADSYLPATFSGMNASGSLGLMINTGSLSFNRDTLDAVAPYYYEILQDRGAAFTSATVTVPTTGLGFNAEDLVIAQSATVNDEAMSLGGQVAAEEVTSIKPVTQLLFTPAEEAKIRITIMNVITPNTDLINSTLFIQNIEFFPKNEVKILNRWGAKVAVIRDYDNLTNFWDGRQDGVGEIVGSGNYVCVVQNTDTKEQLGKQIVTIIR